MNTREAGVLFPIFSIPSKYGIGTLGEKAYEVVDFLSASKVSLWQILPLNVTSFGNSPYQSPSNYGFNFYFIDFDVLINQKLLTQEEVDTINWGDDDSKVDYGAIFNNKLKILRLAFKRFDKNNDEFQEFIKDNKEYSDFSVFMVLKDLHDLRPWYEWEEESRYYSKELEEKVIKDHNDAYLFYYRTQYEFVREYKKLKEYANSKGIKIMGDLPIYVAYDSVDVWKYPSLFELDEKLYPIRVAGCPPDCFSEDGQLWGNPLYNWEYHKKTNYEWWNKRIYSALRSFDYLRIDHFRGFSGYYAIPYKDKTARNGTWVKGPGFDLFKDKIDLPIVAEDLGLLDDDFYEFMAKTNYPGMKIVTQCFDNEDPNNIWRPSNYTYNFFSYTGTHDSQTTKQYVDELKKSQKELLLKILKDECWKLKVPYKVKMTHAQITYKICEINLASASKMAILPIMDLFQVGKKGRINFPSKVSDDNWSYRVSLAEFDSRKDEIIKTLNKWITDYGRNQS